MKGGTEAPVLVLITENSPRVGSPSTNLATVPYARGGG